MMSNVQSFRVKPGTYKGEFMSQYNGQIGKHWAYEEGYLGAKHGGIGLDMVNGGRIYPAKENLEAVS